MKCSAYERVTSVESAMSAAARYGDETLFVAGATDVLIKAREGQPYADRALVDIADISELADIREEHGRLHIGALCTHTQIAGDPLVNRCCGVLSQACATIGSPQIRNRGTIGGNIANASPAADTLPALAALHASVHLLSPSGERTLPLAEVVRGAYKTSIRRGELITEIVVDQLAPEARQRFYKVARRNALAISRLTVACSAWTGSDGILKDLRLALGSVFPSPVVFEEINAHLVGKRPTQEGIAQVADLLSEKIPEIAGVRASTAYKQPVSRTMILRGLAEVLEVK